MRKGTAKYFITYKGKTQNINQWAEELNMSWGALKLRLDYGWSVEEALTLPSGAYRPRKKPAKIDPNKLTNYWSDK